MKDQLKIHDWDHWQSYRKDRGQPPWIKVHRSLMRDLKWVSLSDAERGQLVAIWLLAADHDGVIPASPEILQKLCYMDGLPDINKFIGLGLIDVITPKNDDNVTPQRRQYDAPETETETEGEGEKIGGDDAALARAPDSVEKAFRNWNIAAEALGLPIAEALDEIRRRKIASHLETYGGIEGWNRALGKLEDSPFARGKKGWRIDLDGMLDPTKFNRVVEGSYE